MVSCRHSSIERGAAPLCRLLPVHSGCCTAGNRVVALLPWKAAKPTEVEQEPFGRRISLAWQFSELSRGEGKMGSAVHVERALVTSQPGIATYAMLRVNFPVLKLSC